MAEKPKDELEAIIDIETGEVNAEVNQDEW